MGASTRKYILFSKTTVGKAVHQHPIAVFNQESDVRTYATFLRLAHRAGDVDGAKALDPQTMVAEDGTLIPGTKWSSLEVPYAPTPDFGDDETETSAAPSS
jgi:hypothetical protein